MIDVTNLSCKGQETYLKYCMKHDKPVNMADVVLSEENQKKIAEFITERKNRMQIERIGLEPMNRILMYGASGTGKTYLTSALASTLRLPMLHVDASQLQSTVPAAAIADIFELAYELKKAIIFLDECDSICWARDDAGNQDDGAIRRANNTLFQYLDQMNADYIFVGATNLYDKLDVAFKRRFNIEMKFLAPKIDNFSQAVHKFMNTGFKFIEDMDPTVKAIVDCQARNYSRMSYYQIKDWVHRTEKQAIFKQQNYIRESDIYGLLMSAMRMEVKYDSENKPYLHQYGVQSK